MKINKWKAFQQDLLLRKYKLRLQLDFPTQSSQWPKLKTLSTISNNIQQVEALCTIDKYLGCY